TGLGALTPVGNNIPEFWNNLISGVSGAAFITKFNTEKFRTKFACEVKNFEATKFIDRKEARKMDLFTQFAMVAAEEAINDSGVDIQKIDTDKAGVIWAAGIGGLKTFEEEITSYAIGDGTPRFSPFFIPKMIPDISAGYLSIKYGFRGPNFATVSACASSTNAIIDAYNYICLGKANIMITGGSEAAITEGGIGGFSSMKAISERNDSPETASRPFDKDRDGFVMGEGAGALILEEFEHAKARGAKIYGEIAGSGMSADAYHITAPHPEGIGAQKVMSFALEDAGMSPDEIDYINVHGTSTPLGDISETLAIKKIFGPAAYKVNISATKSMTGHLLGAAGAVETIICVLSIIHSAVPPTINHFTDDDQIDKKLNLTFNKTQERKVNVAMSNTFGFGGHNTSVIIKKFT
ncbi:MAG TPA: beta-ketoacyl-ACP synthase II, partial [Cyclobacteriaceae bacterium]|nr:beta-ketoacyl-ACP synthase II [Cyclobacteriaceae bacterium]